VVGKTDWAGIVGNVYSAENDGPVDLGYFDHPEQAVTPDKIVACVVLAEQTIASDHRRQGTLTIDIAQVEASEGAGIDYGTSNRILVE
jgi:hypothetical protein